MGTEGYMNHLAAIHPEIAAQWHPGKNGRLSAENITVRSGRKVWWQCEKGHEWQATVASRSAGCGCPICAGKKVLKGYNDLASVNPKLAEQWHPAKNGNLTPADVTKGSGKKVWWQCEKGHEWEAVISSRSRGCGCPHCKAATSFAEQALYFYIRQLYKAENKYRILKREIDIYLPDLKIGVEHDGPLHLQAKIQEADRRKDLLCKENGIYLIRVKDPFPFSVDTERSVVYYTYDENDYTELELAIRETLSMISLRTGSRKEIHVDVARDQTAIQDQYREYELEHSIFTKVPDAQTYWDWQKNTLNPLYITYGSGQKIHWKCVHGHDWVSSAADFSRGGRCPVCCGRRVLAGFNDLATIDPKLAREWHPTMNGALTPGQVTIHSGKQIWWQCERGHEWQATVASRSNGTGCAVCSGKRLLRGFNDLATVKAELILEWDVQKNKELTPQAVTVMSKQKVWWRCKEGHGWRAEIGSRARGSGCPYCAGKKVMSGFNDLLTKNAQLAAQWHPTKNGSLLPQDVTEHSSKKVWWKCPNGHEWKTAVSWRSQGNGCPYCSGRLAVQGVTDLKTVCPELAAEWHPTHNGALRPENFTKMSEKQIWWKCGNGHSWKTAIANRTAGTGCPYCSGRRAIKGYNDLFTVHPALCREWDYEKNADLYPYDMLPQSNKKVWWKCAKGHGWHASICGRTAGNGCPICGGKQVLPGYNDLATVRPDLAQEWHPNKNAGITPKDITTHSK